MSLAYQEGCQAWVDGLKQEDNPYHPSSFNYEEWNKGWLAACMTIDDVDACYYNLY